MLTDLWPTKNSFLQRTPQTGRIKFLDLQCTELMTKAKDTCHMPEIKITEIKKV